ncbi:hypothetical protein GCM10010232_03250 [Streptomyces amakusaensis]|uniref:Calcium-binding protein n=1 Tax=Streptomyces amakusaensis TaxID=67271 RepID=A0ABW0AMV0_9ACTN
MRISSTAAALGTVLALSASVLAVAPAASAAQAAPAANTGVKIEKLVVNGGKPIVIGTGQNEKFSISVTVSDNSGIDHKGLPYLGIKREVGDNYWGYFLEPSCKAKNRTTSVCTSNFTSEPKGYDLPRNYFAGNWQVYLQFTAKDGDYYGAYHGTHPFQRRAALTVDAGPEPVRKNKNLTVTGKLSRANWDTLRYAGYTNQPVKLQFRKKGTNSYSTVKLVKTNSTGNLKTTVKATTDGYWRWNFPGTTSTSTTLTSGDFVDVR